MFGRLPWAALLWIVLAAFSVPASAEELPAITGPIASQAIGSAARDYPFFASNQPLATHGYVEEEFFVEGRARRHTSRYPARTFEGGQFQGEAAPFKTRIVVRRPVDRRQSNGAVVVEWNNVSNRFDADNVWFSSWAHLVRSGYTWVGVTAQGHGGAETLSSWSPRRYGDLRILNDGRMAWEPYALGIFDQVGRLLRSPAGARIVGEGSNRTFIAAGQSQSAMWLATYINGGLGRHGPYDAYLLLSASVMPVRPDAPAPVLRIVPEGDLFRPREAALTPSDTARYRQWEIAGASHVDRYLRSNREPTELRDLGTSVQAALAPTCTIPSIGTSTPAHLVIAAGLDHLVTWSRGGAAPPVAPRMAREQTPEGPRLARDANGAGLGGIRLPNLEAPTSLEVGANSGPEGCEGQGYNIPFTVEELRTRYRSPAERLRKYRRSAERAARAGFIPKYAASELIVTARGEAW